MALCLGTTATVAAIGRPVVPGLPGLSADARSTPSPGRPAAASRTPPATSSATPAATPGATPGASASGPRPSAGSERDEEPEPPAVPESGPGTFTVARAGAVTGGGYPYRVEVEDDSGVDPDGAAARIAEILADERGWARDGRTSFRQVDDDSATLVIRIATPDTTDRLCARYGLDTGGEVNCRAGRTVAVNLRRWQLGSPRFAGSPDEYRALIINHEVGHWLGHGHRGCPGPGRRAPVMMQQIKGLDGCVSNAWPYAENGTYLSGPSVP
ncbi:DUF3152 domain-containing protein [Streptomyces abyssomicinicus]|uniref:DUF3152 domain-containing protein n=1 Tax=Streptomyces abyssomicinicus TaxID=574929 RepID=UPI001FEA14ED|nr:DUF3152 domain-containing protein [Streptomyces abyssomicinicus]